jgi:hypothetical protein
VTSVAASDLKKPYPEEIFPEDLQNVSLNRYQIILKNIVIQK